MNGARQEFPAWARMRFASSREPKPLTLAPALFVIALDERTGRFRIPSRLVRPALGGALLVEWCQRSGEVPPAARLWSPPPVPEGPVPSGDPAWADGDPEWGLREWVEYLGTLAVDRVAGWLVDQGWIRWERRWAVIGRRQVYEPVDNHAVFIRPTHLVRELSAPQEQELTGQDMVLALFLDAVGFVRQSSYVGEWVAPERMDAIRGLVARDYPWVPEICGHVQALAARAASPH